MALLMLLPLTVRAWPPLRSPPSLFVLLGIDMLFRLAFLVCEVDDVLEGPPFGAGRPVPKPKGIVFPASGGSIGEVNGVELAIVPPTPALLVGDLSGAELLPVIEQVVGWTAVTGLMSGLCGEGIPMMNGMLLADALLPLR